MKTKIFGAIVLAFSAFFLGFFSNQYFYKEPQKEVEVFNPSLKSNLEKPKLEFIAYNASEIELENQNPSRLVKLKKRLRNQINQNISGLVTSQAVYFQDLTNNDVYVFGEEELFSPSSLMKVPIMITALKADEISPGFLQKKVVFNEGISEKKFGNRMLGNFETKLINGNSYSISELIEVMIIYSDNEATLSIISELESFDPSLLKKVELALGLNIPIISEDRENVLNVKKYSTFFRTLYHASYLTKEHSNYALKILSESSYGFGLRQAIPKEVVVSHKFGVNVLNPNELQLHHFGIVYHTKKPFLLGVMSKGKNEDNLKQAIFNVASLVFREVDEKANTGNGKLELDIE